MVSKKTPKVKEEKPNPECEACMAERANATLGKSDVYATLTMPLPKNCPDALTLIMDAEVLLMKAGVLFDAASDLEDSPTGHGSVVVSREWSLDWSLENAYLKKTERQPEKVK